MHIMLCPFICLFAAATFENNTHADTHTGSQTHSDTRTPACSNEPERCGSRICIVYSVLSCTACVLCVLTVNIALFGEHFCLKNISHSPSVAHTAIYLWSFQCIVSQWYCLPACISECRQGCLLHRTAQYDDLKNIHGALCKILAMI